MPIISPYYHEERRAGLVRNTNPLRYYAEYPGHKLHIDQNEKLQEYGVCHVIAGIKIYLFLILIIIGLSCKPLRNFQKDLSYAQGLYCIHHFGIVTIH